MSRVDNGTRGFLLEALYDLSILIPDMMFIDYGSEQNWDGSSGLGNFDEQTRDICRCGKENGTITLNPYII